MSLGDTVPELLEVGEDLGVDEVVEEEEGGIGVDDGERVDVEGSAVGSAGDGEG